MKLSVIGKLKEEMYKINNMSNVDHIRLHYSSLVLNT